MKITFPLALFLVFLVLKLTKVIAWSWLWVTAPLWIGVAIVVGVCVIILLAMLVSALWETYVKAQT